MWGKISELHRIQIRKVKNAVKTKTFVTYDFALSFVFCSLL